MSKIYLDPGHGGSDPGATGNGLQEKNVVLDIALYTREYLQNNYSGVSVRMSRTDDSFPSLSDRSNDANSWGADIFVSIHANAFNGTAHGYEDFIFNGNVSNDTRELQDSLHKEIAPLFRNDRGKKQANFAVLRQTSMPAVLTENGFIDNVQDADFLKKDSNLKKVAEAHAKGIAAYLGLSGGSSSGSKPEKESKPTPSKPSGPVADVQGTLNSRYGLSIAVDNIPGPETNKALIKGYQTELNSQFNAGLVVDGIWGPKTEGASVTVRRGASGNLTWILQAALRCKNYSIAVDGVFGGKTERIVKQFQRDEGISVDGIPGPVTFKHLFN